MKYENDLLREGKRPAVAALILTVLLMAVPASSFAEVFLKGNFIELGVHDFFSFGTVGSAPAGFHPKNDVFGTDRRLGFVADLGSDVGLDPALGVTPDGWTVGFPPQTGDHFIPGDSEEGWGVEWTSADGVTEHTFNNFGLNDMFFTPTPDVPILGGLADTSGLPPSNRDHAASWTGTAVVDMGNIDPSDDEALRVEQTVSFNSNDLFVVIDVTLTNVGPTPLKSVEYMRVADPNQDFPWSGISADFITRNWVDSQPERRFDPLKPNRVQINVIGRPRDNEALAIAKGNGLGGGAIGLGSTDPGAVVVAGHPLFIRDPDVILDDPTLYQPRRQDKVDSDGAIAIAFDVGDLVPGQVARIRFAYILEADLLEAMGGRPVLSIVNPVGSVMSGLVNFQASADPFFGALPEEVEKMEFFIHDGVSQWVSLGVDTTADNSNPFTPIWEIVFDTGALPPGILPVGPHLLKVQETDFAGRNGRVTVTEKVVLVDFLDPLLPVVTPPPAITIEALGLGTTLTALTLDPGGLASATDSSGTVPLLTLPNLTGNPFAVGVHTITWTATDPVPAPPTTNTADQTVTIVDTTAPTVTAPPDKTAPSVGATTPVDLMPALASATDIVDGALTPTPDNTGPFAVGVHTITWTATDAAGNTGTDTQTVTVTDSTSPTISLTAVVMQEATGPGTTVVNIGAVSATDNLDPSVTAISDFIGLRPGVPAGTLEGDFPFGSTTITWTATDAAGNIGTATQTVTVKDTTPPNFTFVPLNVTAPATGTTTLVAIGTAVATDTVSLPVTVVSDAPAGNLFPLGTTVVTWTATDAAGNVSTASHTVTVQDTTAPVFTFVPPDILKEAEGPSTVVVIAQAIAVDSIGLLSVTSNAPAAFPVGSTLVTWTAVDLAGNSSTASHTVTIQDTTAPAIAAPANIVVEATGALTPVPLGSATATDAVGVVSLSNNAPIGGFPLGGPTPVVWTAMDAAGNSSSVSQLVTVVDTTPPAIAAPADIVVEATGVLTPVPLGSAIATDALGILSLSNDAPVDGFPIGDTFVTWTALDGSGLSNTAVQLVRVEDTTSPVFDSLPVDIISLDETGAGFVHEVLGSFSATDAVAGSIVAIPTVPAGSGVVLVDGVGGWEADFPTNAAVEVTWTADDGNGNVSIALQTVTVLDMTAPPLAGLVVSETKSKGTGFEVRGRFTPDFLLGRNNDLTLMLVSNDGSVEFFTKTVINVGANAILRGGRAAINDPTRMINKMELKNGDFKLQISGVSGPVSLDAQFVLVIGGRVGITPLF